MIDVDDRNWLLLRRLSHIVNWDKVKKHSRDLSYFKDNNKDCFKNKLRTRTAMIELYPEHIEDMKFLYYIVSSGKYPYEACIHNRDIFVDDKLPNENGLGGHKKGQRKKIHIHVVLCFPNARTNSAVAREFNLNPQFVKMFNSRHEALCYLTHKYEGNFKFPYKSDDCFGTLHSEMCESLVYVQDKFQILDRIKCFIMECPDKLDICDVYDFCKEYHFLSVFKCNRPFINDLIKVHNDKMYHEHERSIREIELLDTIENLKNEIIRLNGFIPTDVYGRDLFR